jgi:sterol desaturase/sphingolipid hydroxylase (fatty acid hydroxylase superfamily)
MLDTTLIAEFTAWTVLAVLPAHVMMAGTAWLAPAPLIGAALLSAIYGGFGAFIYAAVQPRFPPLQQKQRAGKSNPALNPALNEHQYWLNPALNPALNEHQYWLYTSVSSVIAFLQKAWFIQWLRSDTTPVLTTPFTWQASLLAFACIMLCYDITYYGFHRFFLHGSYGFTHVHKFHHQLTTPHRLLDAVYLHPLEAFIGMWLLYLPLVLGVRMRLAIHLSAVVLWEASIALMVIYHSGMQVAWPGALLARALGGSLRDKSPVFSIAAHDLHHRNGRCNFALFTRWVDAAFGTEGG